MINEKFKTIAKGFIDYELKGPNGSTFGHVDNLVVANARNIVAKAVMGQSVVDRINVLNTAVSLASVPTAYSLAASDTSQFVAEFDEASFNGVLDQARLESNADGIFSDITGLSIAKDNVTRLIMTWTIQFI